MIAQTSRKLKMLGMLLFLLGLVTGFVIMNVRNPRMGLAAHLEAVMNGTFLVVAGLIWRDLKISDQLRKILFLTLIYGTFANWFFTLLSAYFGTSKMTPLSGATFTGTDLQEKIIAGGLISLSLAIVFSLVVIVYGLRGNKNDE
jgi:hydroxylaminobenzene mutase